MASVGRKTIDTSPQYIKMCKAAHEIQEEKWQKGYYEGDYIYILPVMRYTWLDMTSWQSTN